MKIDWSKWYFTPATNGEYFSGRIDMFNPSEDIELAYYIYGDNSTVEPNDDPIQSLKELCKREIRRYYFNREMHKMMGQKIPVEDNLDYIENEAVKRGLI